MADVTRDADGYYTGPGETNIPLSSPVKREGGDSLVQVTLKEPTAKQLSAFFQRTNQTADDGISAMVNLIADCSGTPPADVENMRQRDFDRCSAWLALFTKGQPSGSKTG